MRKQCCYVMCGFVVGLFSMTADGEVQYTVTNVRPLGQPSIEPRFPGADGLNSHGDMVGFGVAPGGTSSRPFYFEYPVNLVLNLGDLNGDFTGASPTSGAYAINDNRLVVGHSLGETRPFLWKDDNANSAVDPGEMRELALNPGATRSVAKLINNANQVVISGDSGSYLWTDDNGDLIVDAGERVMITDDPSSYSINGMNDSGSIVWEDSRTGNGYHWHDANHDGVQDTGEVTTFAYNLFGGSRCSPIDVNEANQVVGWGRDWLNKAIAFVWSDLDSDAQVDFPDEMTFLGQPSNTFLYTKGINDHGQVVGRLVLVGSVQYGVIWDATNGIRYLNDLIDPTLGIDVRQPEAINNNGQIASNGYIDDGMGGTIECALLLTPRVKPDLNYDGSVDGTDLDEFLDCMTGPALGPPTTGCEEADFDEDDDVDVADAAVLQRCISLPGIPPLQTCDD